MKGRKLLLILFPVALAVLLLSLCNLKQTPKGKINAAYFYGESIWPVKIENEYSPSSEATVMFNGVEFTGIYDNTETYFPMPRPVLHWYKGDGFSFAISEDDGECYSFLLEIPHAEVCTFDAIRGREISDAFADNYISLDEYKVTESVSTSSHSHSYVYTREVDGICTSDRLNISLDCEGQVKGFGQWQLGAFENVKSVNIDEEKVKAAIERRCREFYTGEKSDFVSYEIRDSELLLVKTEANQCALCYTVAPRFRYKNDDHDTGDWLRKMLVIVDYEKYDWFQP